MVIGVTGSFGTGKTTVAKIFSRLGAIVIDADKIAHKLIEPGTRIYKKVLREFGTEILDDNHKDISRKALARVVFNDKAGLKKLCRIVHPVVIKEIKAKIGKVGSRRIVVIDAPLLIEAGLYSIVDKLVVVKANKSTQIERIKKHTGLTKEQIEKRLQFQMPLREKIKIADFVIDNNGSLRETKNQVREIWKRIATAKALNTLKR